jgi:hypothetical protein
MRGSSDDDVDAPAYDVHRFPTDRWNDLLLHGFGGHGIRSWCLLERGLRSAGRSPRRSNGCDHYDRRHATYVKLDRRYEQRIANHGLQHLPSRQWCLDLADDRHWYAVHGDGAFQWLECILLSHRRKCTWRGSRHSSDGHPFGTTPAANRDGAGFVGIRVAFVVWRVWKRRHPLVLCDLNVIQRWSNLDPGGYLDDLPTSKHL